MPFVLPPRDYDAEDSPKDIAGKKESFQYAAQEGGTVEDQKSSISRKSSTSSSSGSDEEKPKEIEIVNEVSIVKSEVKIEEVSPGLNEDFEKGNFEDVAPVVNASDPNEVVISGSIKIDETAGLENAINPIEKPPRSYSDVSDIRIGKQVRSNTNPTVTLQPSVMEENVKDAEQVVKSEGKIDEKAPEAGRDVETKMTNKYQIMIERGFKGEIESKTFDEEILKDLPESSVDSDSELIEAQNTKLGERPQNISIQDGKTTLEDANVDDVKTAIDGENVVDAVNENSENHSLDDDGVTLRTDMSTNTPNKEEDTALTSSEKDRSSFMEAFSKDPSFGSWFSGETTIIEQDKGDEQAEEIASKVIFLNY